MLWTGFLPPPAYYAHIMDGRQEGRIGNFKARREFKDRELRLPGVFPQFVSQCGVHAWVCESVCNCVCAWIERPAPISSVVHVHELADLKHCYWLIWDRGEMRSERERESKTAREKERDARSSGICIPPPTWPGSVLVQIKSKSDFS